MHNYHPSYMFNAPEVNNEYNLLNDFLNNSLLDDGALLPDDTSNFYPDQPGVMLPSGVNSKQLCSLPEILKAIPFHDLRVLFQPTRHVSIIFKPLIQLAMMHLRRECNDSFGQNMMLEC
jgi:hypothetical protein